MSSEFFSWIHEMTRGQIDWPRAHGDSEWADVTALKCCCHALFVTVALHTRV